jgi:hypothetical protein
MKTSFLKPSLMNPVHYLLASLFLFLPFSLSFLYFSIENQKIELLGERVLFVQNKLKTQDIQGKKEKKNLRLIKNSKPSYLEESLKSLSFLKRERQKWKIHTAQKDPTDAIKKRTAFLEGEDNHLEFSESKKKKNSFFTESILKQKRTVELNEEDLKSVLCLVEGVEIAPYLPKEGSPQLLITSFTLEKKSPSETGDRNYTLEMELIKRESIR